LGTYTPKVGLGGVFDVAHRLDKTLKNRLNAPGARHNHRRRLVKSSATIRRREGSADGGHGGQEARCRACRVFRGGGRGALSVCSEQGRRVPKGCCLRKCRLWAIIGAGHHPRQREELFLDKKVRVKGLVKEYQGAPEIIVEEPEQIEVVE